MAEQHREAAAHSCATTAVNSGVWMAGELGPTISCPSKAIRIALSLSAHCRRLIALSPEKEEERDSEQKRGNEEERKVGRRRERGDEGEGRCQTSSSFAGVVVEGDQEEGRKGKKVGLVPT